MDTIDPNAIIYWLAISAGLLWLGLAGKLAEYVDSRRQPQPPRRYNPPKPRRIDIWE